MSEFLLLFRIRPRSKQLQRTFGQTAKGPNIILNSSLSQAALEKRNQHLRFRPGIGSVNQPLRMSIPDRRLEVARISIQDLANFFADRAILRSELAPQRTVGATEDCATLPIGFGLSVVNMIKVIAQSL